MRGRVSVCRNALNDMSQKASAGDSDIEPKVFTRRSTIRESTLVANTLVGPVDDGELVGGETHKFLRHAAGNQTVGMIFANQQKVRSPDFLVAGAVSDTQDCIRVTRVRSEMGRANAAELVRGKAEDIRNGLEKREFAGVQYTVRLGNFAQPVEDIFQHRRVVAEHACNLASVRFVTCGILSREIEDAPDVGFFGGRDTEYAKEGIDLVVRDYSIRLRHFGPKRDDRDGESNARFIVLFPVEKDVAGYRARKRADGPRAEQETGRGAAHFSPDGHKGND